MWSNKTYAIAKFVNSFSLLIFVHTVVFDVEFANREWQLAIQ